MKVISYSGKYPNLCEGTLLIEIDGKEWTFPEGCMKSGGSVSFNDEREEFVSAGEWSISKWPDGFPEDKKEAVWKMVNEQIPLGCCRGCV